MLFGADNRVGVLCRAYLFSNPETPLNFLDSFGVLYTGHRLALASDVSIASADRCVGRPHQKRPTAEKLLLPAVGRLSVSCIVLGKLQAFQLPSDSV